MPRLTSKCPWRQIAIRVQGATKWIVLIYSLQANTSSLCENRVLGISVTNKERGMGNQNSKLTSQDKAILEMKLQRDKLRQYQKKIVLILDRETAIARQCLKKGDKQRSLLALRQKKYQQSMLEKTDEQLMILEQLVRMRGHGSTFSDCRRLPVLSLHWLKKMYYMGWRKATRSWDLSKKKCHLRRSRRSWTKRRMLLHIKRLIGSFYMRSCANFHIGNGPNAFTSDYKLWRGRDLGRVWETTKRECKWQASILRGQTYSLQLPQMPEVPKTLILPQAPNHAVEQDEQVEEIRNPQYAWYNKQYFETPSDVPSWIWGAPDGCGRRWTYQAATDWSVTVILSSRKMLRNFSNRVKFTAFNNPDLNNEMETPRYILLVLTLNVCLPVNIFFWFTALIVSIGYTIVQALQPHIAPARAWCHDLSPPDHWLSWSLVE